MTLAHRVFIKRFLPFCCKRDGIDISIQVSDIWLPIPVPYYVRNSIKTVYSINMNVKQVTRDPKFPDLATAAPSSAQPASKAPDIDYKVFVSGTCKIQLIKGWFDCSWV
jgi:hypothetical protein